MADGNAVVAAAVKENATFLLAEHETAWWRMQSPDAAQVHDGAVIKFLPIPIKTKTSSASMNGRRILMCVL